MPTPIVTIDPAVIPEPLRSYFMHMPEDGPLAHRVGWRRLADDVAHFQHMLDRVNTVYAELQDRMEADGGDVASLAELQELLARFVAPGDEEAGGYVLTFDVRLAALDRALGYWVRHPEGGKPGDVLSTAARFEHYLSTGEQS